MVFAQAGKILLQMNPSKATLEDIFIEITALESNEAADPAEADPSVPADEADEVVAEDVAEEASEEVIEEVSNI